VTVIGFISIVHSRGANTLNLSE